MKKVFGYFCQLFIALAIRRRERVGIWVVVPAEAGMCIREG